MFGRRAETDLVDTDELNAFFAALGRLDDAELSRMRAAWRSIGRPDHEKAWAEVRAVGARDGLSAEIDRVRDRALVWARKGSNRPGHELPDDMTWLEIKMEAAEAIVDAALATALGGRLDGQTRATLLTPWESVRPRREA